MSLDRFLIGVSTKPTAINDPWAYVEKFKHAAQMAKKAGFDGVELHSATGYLPHQFLDYSAKKRTDEWGGSESRMPLPDTIQTYTFYFTELASMKLAYIQFVRDFPSMDITVPCHPHVMHSSDTTTRAYKRGTPHDVLAVYGGLFKPLPSALQDPSEDALRGAAAPRAPFAAPTPTRVLVNGGVLPAGAEESIARCVVDAVVFGTPWIMNPNLQKRIERNLPLNTQLDLATLYEGVEGDIRAGHTTYARAGEPRLSV